MAFADDEKPPKDVREEINKTAKTTGKNAKKDLKTVRKQVNKPWEKVTEDGSAKTKD
jgi:ribosome recycling factor